MMTNQPLLFGGLVLAAASALATGAAADPPPSPDRTKWALMAWNMAELHRLAGQGPSDSPGERAAWAELESKVASDPAYAWLKDPSPEMRQRALAALQGKRAEQGAWTQQEIDQVLARQKDSLAGLYSGWRAAQPAPPPDAAAPREPVASQAADHAPPAQQPPPAPPDLLDTVGPSLPPGGGLGDGGRGGAAPNSGPEPKAASAPSLAKNKAFAALKDPSSLGSNGADELAGPKGRPRAPDAHGPGGEKRGPDAPLSGLKQDAAAPGSRPVGAVASVAGVRTGVAGGPSYGSASAGSAALAVAAGGADHGTGVASVAPTADAPVSGALKPSAAKAGPGGAPPAVKTATKDPGELSEEEKRELSDIQKLLKDAAEDGSLDPAALAGAAAKLPEGSLALQEVKERIRDIVAMAGGELSMAQRQEVIELAGRLGLDEAQARALVRSLERAEPLSPKNGSPRALTWWAWLVRTLAGWWRRLLAWLGLSSAPPAR